MLQVGAKNEKHRRRPSNLSTEFIFLFLELDVTTNETYAYSFYTKTKPLVRCMSIYVLRALNRGTCNFQSLAHFQPFEFLMHRDNESQVGARLTCLVFGNLPILSCRNTLLSTLPVMNSGRLKPRPVAFHENLRLYIHTRHVFSFGALTQSILNTLNLSWPFFGF